MPDTFYVECTNETTLTTDSAELSRMLYHDIANDYSQYCATTEWALGYLYLYKLITAKFKENTTINLLDYGCGEGKFCRFFYENAKQYYPSCKINIIGLDISQDLITVAKQYEATMPNKRPLAYQVIKSGKIPLENNSIDFCTMSFVLCTLATKKEMIAILAETHRVLKPNGMLLMLNVNWNTAAGKNYVSFYTQKVEEHQQHLQKVIVHLKKPAGTFVVEEYYRTVEEYCSLLREARFQIDCTLTPTIKKTDAGEWLDERKYPPFAIITGRV